MLMMLMIEADGEWLQGVRGEVRLTRNSSVHHQDTRWRRRYIQVPGAHHRDWTDARTRDENVPLR